MFLYSYYVSLKIYLKYNFKSDIIPVKLSHFTQFQGLLQSDSNGDSVGAKYRRSSMKNRGSRDRASNTVTELLQKAKGNYTEQEWSFQQMTLQYWISMWDKKKKSPGTQTHTYTFPKIKSKWILDLRVKCKIIKLLEERLKAWSKKEKNARFNFIKTKNLSAKDAAGRMKRQAIYWKIVCKIHIREKVFYVKYVKNS